MRLNYRFYLVLLCLTYFTMLYIFHGNLQVEVNSKCRANNCLQSHEASSTDPKLADDVSGNLEISNVELRNIKAMHIPSVALLSFKTLTPVQVNLANLVHTTGKLVPASSPKECYVSSNYSIRGFRSLEPDSFVYSAYFDERYSKRFVRIMAILSLIKQKRKLNVYCHFNVSDKRVTREATFYELCENHGKTYGGFVLSCEVPTEITNLCSITVSMEIKPTSSQYSVPQTTPQTLQVSRLSLDPPKGNKQFNFTICVPPLFGNIATEKFVEFIELNRILGFQHFIIYTARIESQDILKVLDYYRLRNVITTIDFTLPSVIQKSKIWYNGQLSAHNDCLYRAMPITNFVAFMDIDEFIVSHNGQFRVTDTASKQFDASDKICGISFDSAFYDSKYTKNVVEEGNYLVTQTTTGRSEKFSAVRTKVFVSPDKIFEVGIHHISKPAQEGFKVVKVNTTQAYLHHYRSCVPNYGMKCNAYKEDLTMLQYRKHLEAAVEDIFEQVFDKDHELK